MTENSAYNNALDAIARDGVSGRIVYRLPLSWSRGVICTVMIILSHPVCAGSQRPFQPWQPTPFRPNVTSVQRGGEGALGQSPAFRNVVVQTADRKSIDQLQVQMKQRLDAVRTFARDLEQTTEVSLSQGGSLQKSMVDAKVGKHQVDSAMKEIKDAEPKMREAGRMANRALDEVGAAK